MVYRVVSTKLSEEEYSALLEECGTLGVTPSTFVRNRILEALNVEDPQLPAPKTKEEEKMKEGTELARLDAIMKKLMQSAH